MKKVITFLFIFSFIVVPLKANLDSLLLGIDMIKGLIPANPPENYVNNDLFVMIDGGAETYLEYGFDQALDASYFLDSTKRIGIQIYKMNGDGAAFGIYSSNRNDGDSSLNIGDFASGNEFYIMVQKSRFFYIVSAEENLPETKKTITNIASLIASNITEKVLLPELVSKSLSAGFKIEHIKYIRGKIALSGNYFFTHKEIFKTRDAVCIDEGDSKLFIFQYPDKLSATTNLKFINEELVSSGRYTQFIVEEGKFSCLDRNLKHINILVSINHVIVTVGKELDQERMKKVLSTF